MRRAWWWLRTRPIWRRLAFIAWAWRWVGAHISWDRFIFVFSVLIVAGVGLRYTYDVEGRLDCQARYNDTNNQRTRILTEAAEKERVATRAEKKTRAALFTHPALLKPVADRTPADGEEIRRLAVAWQHALTEEQKQQAAADKERAENPVPPPPSSVCD